MKLNVTFQFEVDDNAHLDRIIAAAFGTGVQPTAIEPVAEAPAPASTTAPAADGLTPAQRGAQTRARKKAEKEAAAKAEAEAKANADADLLGGEPSAPADAMTQEEFHGVVAAAIKDTENRGGDYVRAAFAKFEGKNGKPVAKLSDVKPEDYVAVAEAIG